MDIFVSGLFKTLEITLPVFILLFFGWWLKRSKQIDDGFVQQSSGLVFNYALPLLLFLSVYRSQEWGVEHLELAIISSGLAVLLFVLAWLVARATVSRHEERGVFVQGAFRSNLGIIGIALCVQTYGDQGLALGAVVLAVVTPVYNVLSVVVLGHYAPGKKLSVWNTFKAVAKNPLIVAIMAGFALKLFQVPMAESLLKPLQLLAGLSLPLALICIGATLSYSGLAENSRVLAISSLFKLVVAPLLVVILALFLGLKGAAIGVLFIMFASPAATASYVMVRSIGGDAALAANIITMTTVVGTLTISIGIFILNISGII